MPGVLSESCYIVRLSGSLNLAARINLVLGIFGVGAQKTRAYLEKGMPEINYV